MRNPLLGKTTPNPSRLQISSTREQQQWGRYSAGHLNIGVSARTSHWYKAACTPFPEPCRLAKQRCPMGRGPDSQQEEATDIRSLWTLVTSPHHPYLLTLYTVVQSDLLPTLPNSYTSSEAAAPAGAKRCTSIPVPFPSQTTFTDYNVIQTPIRTLH